jgi:hypothetical protein
MQNITRPGIMLLRFGNKPFLTGKAISRLAMTLKRKQTSLPATIAMIVHPAR